METVEKHIGRGQPEAVILDLVIDTNAAGADPHKGGLLLRKEPLLIDAAHRKPCAARRVRRIEAGIIRRLRLFQPCFRLIDARRRRLERGIFAQGDALRRGQVQHGGHLGWHGERGETECNEEA